MTKLHLWRDPSLPHGHASPRAVILRYEGSSQVDRLTGRTRRAKIVISRHRARNPMKPPDRLLDDISVFKFMAKFWIGLPIGFAVLLWLVSSANGPAEFHPWDAVANAASAIAYALLAFFVIIVGGWFFVSLFKIARRHPS